MSYTMEINLTFDFHGPSEYIKALLRGKVIKLLAIN